MKRKGCVLCVLFIVLINICYAQTNRAEDSKGKLVVDLDKAKILPEKDFLTSTFFKSIKIIPLETNESCLIGNITKIIVFEQYIFVLDNFIANSLYVFDKEGRFIRKIGSIGQGPGEFDRISDFAIDRVNKTVYIKGGRFPRIHKYDLATGKFIQTINFDLNAQGGHVNGFVSVGGKLYADATFSEHSDKNYLLFTIDESSGKEKDNYLNVMEYSKGISHENGYFNRFVQFFLRDNGDAIFVQPFMSHVIEITKDGVFSFIEFKGKNLLTVDESKRAKETFYYKNYQKQVQNRTSIFDIDKYNHVMSYIEKGDYIIIDKLKGMRFHRLLINKKTKEVSIFDKGYLDDLLFVNKENQISLTLGCYDANGVYYHAYNSEYTTRFQDLAKAGSLSPNIIGIEKLEKFDKEDNPVLFYYEFRE